MTTCRGDHAKLSSSVYTRLEERVQHRIIKDQSNPIARPLPPKTGRRLHSAVRAGAYASVADDMLSPAESLKHDLPKVARLAVHAVGHAAVPRYAVAEVLDLEPALEAAGEEAAKRRYQRRERRQHERVELRTTHAQVSSTATEQVARKTKPCAGILLTLHAIVTYNTQNSSFGAVAPGRYETHDQTVA